MMAWLELRRIDGLETGFKTEKFRGGKRDAENCEVVLNSSAGSCLFVCIQQLSTLLITTPRLTSRSQKEQALMTSS